MNSNKQGAVKKEKEKDIPKNDSTPDGLGPEEENEPAVGATLKEAEIKASSNNLETKEQKKLAEALEELKLSKNDTNKWKDDYLRLAAEFENYKKRSRQDIEQRLKFATQPLARGLIECLDDLELALDHIKSESSSNSEELSKGLDMALNKFFDLLKTQNILTINALRQDFDPSLHEAVSTEVSEEVNENQVSKVFKRGYMLHDRVIRPAMVQVAKTSPPKT